MLSSKYKDMRFYSEEDTRKIADELEKAVTVPVNIEIEAEHRVYDLSEMREILESADQLGVQDCGCKTTFNNCDSPREVCISLDWMVDEMDESDRQDFREIDIEETLEILKRSHEAGLVHLAYVNKGDVKPFLICSCCPCCCHTLGSLVRSGIHTKILTSKYIATDDKEKCTDCGICVDRCSFKARQMNDGELIYDQSKCFGCGLCVSTCPAEAISLVQRG
ncbi:MAG: 4Fe-4S binding protein [Candidatus Bathyarchaeota archaeon]|jgi:Pyruvate/2-oxoacid:ferredoxin oxidoreductase delta subunit